MALQDLALAARYYELLGGREDFASPSDVATLRDSARRKVAAAAGRCRVIGGAGQTCAGISVVRVVTPG
jgi:hypothetical protein